jgi:hypothetical protein
VAAVLIVCAFLVLNGSRVGRWAGIVADAIGCIHAIWWMPYYPIWSLTHIALGIPVYVSRRHRLTQPPAVPPYR